MMTPIVDYQELLNSLLEGIQNETSVEGIRALCLEITAQRESLRKLDKNTTNAISKPYPVRHSIKYPEDADYLRNLAAIVEFSDEAGNDTVTQDEAVRQRKYSERVCVSPSVPLKNGAGDIIGLPKFAHDITPRIITEIDLERLTQELAYQYNEKEKRAAELVLINRKLTNQNLEKEERAHELLATNDELKSAKEQLQAVIHDLESFSYSVSHDLRAPLRAIHGYTQILNSDYQSQLDTEAKRLMNNILRNATKMSKLIDDLLTFSRLGRKELIRVNIPMQDIVTRICNEIKTAQSERDIEFDIKTMLPISADNTAIKQVWLNLISNAVKSTRRKTKAIIEIGSEKRGLENIYYIKDNGVGFDMRYSDKLFGVFQRLHSDEDFEGTGVGLAIVQRIIIMHGGRIWAEGKENKGATFFFALSSQDLYSNQ